MPEEHSNMSQRPAAGLPAGTLQPRSLSFASRRLVRDFLLLLDFDLNVLRYERRGVQINYADGQGRRRVYTPEFLITYRTDIIPAKWMPPLLCEVSHRNDLFHNWQELRPMLRAARSLARKRGWRFQVVTEREVYTPYLNNVGFLLPYRRMETNWEHADLLMEMLYELRAADPEALLAACSDSPARRLELLSSLWHLVSLRRVGVDLTQPLTMRSTIWTQE
jgi:TnsA endonuclease N terminal/TnsA endonuclease C terminal